MSEEPGAVSPRGRAAVVFNPAKVDVAALRSVVGLEEARSGWGPSEWFETSADDDGLSAAVEAAASGPDLILVAGGDGTLRAAAEALAGTGIPLGLLPTGTGNLFARELRLPLNGLAESVATAFRGADRPIDVGLAVLQRPDGTESRHAFLVMAGIGVDAHMAAHTNERLKKRIGWVAYSDPIARSVLGNRQFDMVYRLDDRPEVATRAHTVIVGNSGSLPAGLLLLPAAVVDDGLLDAVVFRPGRGPGWTNIGYRLTFNRVLHRTRFGRLVARVTPKPRAIQWAQAKHFELRLSEPQELQLDGDPQGLVSAASLSVRHHGLTIRVPERSLAA
ncbi:diacylglycerol/lipid kinase family protein [Herbiconiux daphne]|uniref:Diacylglycerol kinase family protein n=1 Tax=Herbiconiux daphne TaxID=2970914 RepID=A0ABT2H3H0_9MICO|nr:diacylglycerol kinase family protein [Herbiconiux daphne]MCS5734485.1 diacylglycerol kinase family protein [Herbiconiux daphne]